MATVTLGSKAEGSIIKLKENGVLVDFYIAKQNYESGLNGAGRVLVVRKDCYDQRQWHGSNVNAYATSAIDTWLNGTYKNLLDANIRTAMGTTKIYYTPGNGNTTKTTLERSVFLLSATELGQAHTYMNAEGTALSATVLNLLKIAYLNGSAVYQWTRSPYTNGTNLGTKNAGFDLTYTVTDADGDTVTVKEYMDNVLMRTYTATLGQSNTFQAVTAANFQKVLNGDHTLKVVANDGKADSAPYTVTFTKAVHKASVTLQAPLEADDVISVCVVHINGYIPADAKIKVEVTNNANDITPPPCLGGCHSRL